LLCPRTRFFSFLIIHIHRVSLQRSFFFWNDTHTHIFYLHCPWHQRPLSLPPAFRPLHRHPRPPPPLSTTGAHVSLSLLSLPPASRPLRRPYVFVLATDALVHRRPSICWPPTTSHIILSLIKVTFFIPFERCVSLVVVAGIPTRSPSPS
jgi:hypothetical protein